MADASPQLFDSHIHLDRLPEKRPLSELLQTARSNGIGHWLVPGVRRQNWQELVRCAAQAPDVWVAPGLHPLAADQWCDESLIELDALLRDPKVVAVGEIGLDRMVARPMKEQEQVFQEQLELAARNNLPVLVHCRRSWGRALDILRAQKLSAGGILHAFGGSLEIARQAVGLGFAIGFGGPLTYPNARTRVEVLQGLPADAVVLETDAPDLSPHPHRQQANRPEWLVLVARRVAELRGWSLDETARITTDNVSRILKIPNGGVEEQNGE